ncbi:MAG: protein-L-isoaspartate(D-aspartate) O-methyltransferase [Planctomycetales bacterium]
MNRYNRLHDCHRRPRHTTTAGLSLLVLLLASVQGAGNVWGQGRDKYIEARLKMVEESLVREGIRHEGVLRSMRQVPRHLFCTPQHRAAAYFDQSLPIGHKQTISAPFIVAYMTEMLDPQPEDKVLEIGTGSGYQAAVLSALVKEVYTIEIVEALGKNAAKVLKEQRYDNVFPLVGDGYKGWPEHAPFDKIIVTCSPENVPEPLVEQLREGGKMIIPLGERFEQVFYMFEKRNGELVKKKLLPTLFVPMTGISEVNRKVKPDPARPELHNGGFEDDEDSDGHPEGWHYQRQLKRETKDAPQGEAYVVFTNRDQGRGAMALQGFAIDGAKVGALQISLQVMGDNIRSGSQAFEKAALMVQFYDGDRKPMEPVMLGPWQGTFDWKQASKVIPVPPKAREAILRVGLNGATGTLGVDDVQMKPLSR